MSDRALKRLEKLGIYEIDPLTRLRRWSDEVTALAGGYARLEEKYKKLKTEHALLKAENRELRSLIDNNESYSESDFSASSDSSDSVLLSSSSVSVGNSQPRPPIPPTPRTSGGRRTV